MDTLPQNWLELYKIAANPITFGILISMILGSLKFMAKDATWKDGTTPIPASLKMAVVLASCLVWSILVNVLSPDGFVLTKDSAYTVLLMAFSVAFASQIWHTVVSPFIAQIIAILFGISANLKARAMRL